MNLIKTMISKFIAWLRRQLDVFVMRNLRRITTVVELSKWFHRKSQHYIMSNWAKYEKKDYYWNKTNNPQKAQNYKYYKRYFLTSYFKFMWLCRNDIKNV